MNNRFNKNNVKEYLCLQMARLEKEWGFDPSNGFSQVEKSDFKRVMAYGEYEALNDMYDAIEYRSI